MSEPATSTSLFTPEQERIRSERVTASTAAAFLGYDSYKDPLSAWEEHTGRKARVESEDTLGGRRFERPIIESAIHILRHELSGGGEYPATDFNPGTIVSPSWPWLAATPDCLLPEDGTGIQAKNQRPHMLRTYLGTPGTVGKWDNELVPRAYLFQVQVEMMVVSDARGWDTVRWFLASHFGGPQPRVYRIRRDEKLQAAIAHATFLFWRRHIDPAGPKEPPEDVEWLARPLPAKRRGARLGPEQLITAPLPDLPPAPAADLMPPPFSEKPNE